MHAGIANPRWWGKRSRRMRNTQFCVSGKRSMDRISHKPPGYHPSLSWYIALPLNHPIHYTCLSLGQDISQTHPPVSIHCHPTSSWTRISHGAPFILSQTPLCISMISGVCVQGMWNAQVKGQVTETHRLKVNSHCDTALFISMYDITMVQP